MVDIIIFRGNAAIDLIIISVIDYDDVVVVDMTTFFYLFLLASVLLDASIIALPCIRVVAERRRA